jgi:hypothetical protein
MRTIRLSISGSLEHDGERHGAEVVEQRQRQVLAHQAVGATRNLQGLDGGQ